MKGGDLNGLVEVVRREIGPQAPAEGAERL
jgi:hypothetical protein